MIPMWREQRTLFFLYGILPVFHAMFEYMEGVRNLQKKLKFFYTPSWRHSPSGIDIGESLSHKALSVQTPYQLSSRQSM